MPARVVFMGSPEFALPTLQSIASAFPVAGVVTQPDRPAGRGRVLTAPPVKILAQDLGLEVIQPRRLSQPEAMEQLHHWKPDVIVVAAFGQILKPEVLDLPPHGCVNVHASLLPRWRGAAPIIAAILHGDQTTGVTIMRMDPGVDTGPVLSQRSLEILPDDTSETLSRRLAVLGSGLLIETLPRYLSGEIQPKPQDSQDATYAPMLKKGDGRLDFTKPALELERQVRAMNPWPGASMLWNDRLLKIHRAHTVDASPAGAQPGTTLVYQGLPAVATGSGVLILDEIQPAGKNSLAGEVFLHGARDWA